MKKKLYFSILLKKLSKIPIIPGRGLTTKTATDLRLDFLKSENLKLEAIEDHHLDIKSIQNNIESFIGSIEIPIGIVGPIVFNDNDSKEFVYAPVGTLEGALVYSMNRGAKVIALSNGFTAKFVGNIWLELPLYY